MKKTGITRKVDDMGRIVLPIELRRNMGIDEGTALEIYLTNDGVVLRPVERPLTPEDMKNRIGKPVLAKTKTTGVCVWIIVEDGDNEDVYSTDGGYYTFSHNDFFDHETE